MNTIKKIRLKYLKMSFLMETFMKTIYGIGISIYTFPFF